MSRLLLWSWHTYREIISLHLNYYYSSGIGMTLEDSIRFWRTELTKRGEVDVDKFEKEYAYGIRYNYGKVCIYICRDGTLDFTLYRSSKVYKHILSFVSLKLMGLLSYLIGLYILAISTLFSTDEVILLIASYIIICKSIIVHCLIPWDPWFFLVSLRGIAN